MRLRVYLLLFILAVLLSPIRTSASQGVVLTVRVEEGVPSDSASFKLIDQREVQFPNGKQKASFQANFTLTVTPEIIDSENATLDLSLITLPPQPQTVFKEVLAKSGQTFLLAEVRVKGDRVFRVYLTPEIGEVADSECGLDSRNKEADDWDELPSAHFFFRYLLNSLADLHWSRLKGEGETEYRRFRDEFGFTQPAMDRMEYYLLPCRVPEITWDHRFDIGLDPVRNKLYAVYNLTERSLDSPGVGFLLFYRIWGYAPPMLAEGIGNYFSLSHHFTKKLVASRRWIPLRKLLVTKDYRSQPEDVAFWEASSFTRFLVTAYTQGKFKNLYQKSSDLTLEGDLEEVYQKNLGTLEREWLSFLEGYRDSISDFYYAAQVKTANLHYDEATQLYEDMLNLYGREVGILRSLAYVYYLQGNYDMAERYYQEVLSRDTLNLEYLNILGNIKRIKGEYGRAMAYYQKVIDLDSTYVEPRVRLAELQILNGDLLPAEKQLERALARDPGTQLKLEIYLDLGSIYQKLDREKEARPYFENALFYGRRFIVEFEGKPIPYFRLGESFFHVGEVDSAIHFYKIAEFLEERPLYQSRVSLALALAYREKNDRSAEEGYLQEVLALPAGYEEKKEARKLLASFPR
jgi:tetratricopeptide (TPR) repeat protein